jgi:PTH1 family peptidyl-tRNA hydrolase
METLDFSLPEFLVVVDDFSLPLGTTRMRAKGSSGGHKGLESLIYHLESSEFPRLRIGIGPKIGESVDFVLSEFTKKELVVLDEAIEHAVLSVHTFVSEGIDRAIEVCNARQATE